MSDPLAEFGEFARMAPVLVAIGRLEDAGLSICGIVLAPALLAGPKAVYGRPVVRADVDEPGVMVTSDPPAGEHDEGFRVTYTVAVTLNRLASVFVPVRAVILPHDLLADIPGTVYNHRVLRADVSGPGVLV